MILQWETEREDGVTTSRLTFDGDLAEWMVLCEEMPDFATNVLVRNLTNICLSAGRPKDDDDAVGD
jgi:hypothetical protein